jgi:hypothetical protein
MKSGLFRDYVRFECCVFQEMLYKNTTKAPAVMARAKHLDDD